MKKDKNFAVNFKKGAVAVYLFILTFVFMMQSPLCIWRPYGETGTDSSVFKTVALYMEKGFMPYKDIFDHKGPLIYLYNYIGLKIEYWRGIWIIEFISLMITFLLIYKIERLICNRVYACLTLLIVSAPLYYYFESGNLTEEYALPFITAALFIFCDYFLNDKINSFRLLLCGFSFAAVCLLRVNMITVWVVFCIGVLVKCIQEKREKVLIRYIIWFVIGAVLLMLPIIIWLVFNGAFGDFIKDYIIFNQTYTNKDSAPLSSKIEAFISFINNTEILIAVLTSCYLAYKKRDLFHIIYFAYALTSFLFICMSGMLYQHYAMVLVPMISYLYAKIFQLGERNEDNFSNTSNIVIIYLLTTLAFPLWLNGVNHAVSTYYTRDDNREWNGTTTNVVKYVVDHTDEEDRIVVWGNWDIIYARSKRLCSSKYSYVYPIAWVDEKIFPQYYQELRENKPKLIITKDGMDLTMQQFIEENGYFQADIIDNMVSIYTINEANLADDN